MGGVGVGTVHHPEYELFSFMACLDGHLLSFLTQGGCKCILLVKWRVKQIFVDQKGRLCWHLGFLIAHVFSKPVFGTRLVYSLTSCDCESHRSISDQWIEMRILCLISGLCVLILIQEHPLSLYTQNETPFLTTPVPSSRAWLPH